MRMENLFQVPQLIFWGHSNSSNCFRTRDDGTFTLALSDRDRSVPVGAGLYFRIRPANETADNPVRWHSTYFWLDPNNPEMLLDIRIPE